MISGPTALLASKVEIISKIYLDELKTTDSKMYWKTIHMLIKNERSANTMPPLRDRDNNFNLSYDCFEKAGILNRHFCSVSDLNDRNKDFKLLTRLRCCLYCFSAETVLVLKNAFRSLSRLRDSRHKFESNHILSSVRRSF
jgi:hypothetical protein